MLCIIAASAKDHCGGHCNNPIIVEDSFSGFLFGFFNCNSDGDGIINNNNDDDPEDDDKGGSWRFIGGILFGVFLVCAGCCHQGRSATRRSTDHGIEAAA